VAIAMKEAELSKIAVKTAVDPELLAQLVDALVKEKLKAAKEKARRKD
jgi:hypothetical protein